MPAVDPRVRREWIRHALAFVGFEALTRPHAAHPVHAGIPCHATTIRGFRGEEPIALALQVPPRSAHEALAAVHAVLYGPQCIGRPPFVGVDPEHLTVALGHVV